MKITLGVKKVTIASTLPDGRSDFQRFIESINPLQVSPIKPASHVAQAINFAKSVGSVAYDYNAYQAGKTVSISNNNDAINTGAHSVYVSISGYSEVGKSILENLRASHGLKELSDAEISDYISGVLILFNSGIDYSHLFWTKVDGNQNPEMQLSQIGAPAIPLAPSTPLVLPVGENVSGINSKNGAIVVSTEAISREMAATIAPALLQMSKKKGNQTADDLPRTIEELNALRTKIKERQTANNGKVTREDKKLLDKIKTQEKAIKERNKQKRGNK
jgi:hypothetical protein